MRLQSLKKYLFILLIISTKPGNNPPKLGYDHRKNKNNDVQSQTRIHSITMPFVSMATPCFSLAWLYFFLCVCVCKSEISVAHGSRHVDRYWKGLDSCSRSPPGIARLNFEPRLQDGQKLVDEKTDKCQNAQIRCCLDLEVLVLGRAAVSKAVKSIFFGPNLQGRFLITLDPVSPRVESLLSCCCQLLLRYYSHSTIWLRNVRYYFLTHRALVGK